MTDDWERAHRDRVESDRRGWAAVARGDHLGAINAFAGPEAAAFYAARIAGTDGWPVYSFALDLDDFIANMKALTREQDSRVRDVTDGLATIEAVWKADPDTVIGTFTAPVEVLAAFLDRCATMAMSADDTSRVRALRDHLGR